MKKMDKHSKNLIVQGVVLLLLIFGFFDWIINPIADNLIGDDSGFRVVIIVLLIANYWNILQLHKKL